MKHRALLVSGAAAALAAAYVIAFIVVFRSDYYTTVVRFRVAGGDMSYSPAYVHRDDPGAADTQHDTVLVTLFRPMTQLMVIANSCPLDQTSEFRTRARQWVERMDTSGADTAVYLIPTQPGAPADVAMYASVVGRDVHRAYVLKEDGHVELRQ